MYRTLMLILVVGSLNLLVGCQSKTPDVAVKDAPQVNEPQLNDDDIVSTSIEYFDEAKTKKQKKTQVQRDGRRLVTYFKEDGTRTMEQDFGPKGDYVISDTYDEKGERVQLKQCRVNNVLTWDRVYLAEGNWVTHSYRPDGTKSSRGCNRTPTGEENAFTENFLADGKTVAWTYEELRTSPQKNRHEVYIDSNGKPTRRSFIREFTWGHGGFRFSGGEEPKPYWIDLYLRADGTQWYRQTVCMFYTREDTPGVYQGLTKVEEFAADGKTIKRVFFLKPKQLPAQSVLEKIVDHNDDGTTTQWEVRRDGSLFRDSVTEADGTITELNTHPRGTKLPESAGFPAQIIELFESIR
jgi:hypothetical protein